jgi:hypothetical protein
VPTNCDSYVDVMIRSATGNPLAQVARNIYLNGYIVSRIETFTNRDYPADDEQLTPLSRPEDRRDVLRGLKDDAKPLRLSRRDVVLVDLVDEGLRDDAEEQPRRLRFIACTHAAFADVVEDDEFMQ